MLGDEVGDLAPEPREDAHVGRRRTRGGEGLYVLGGGQELVPLDKLGALFVVGLVIDEAGIGDWSNVIRPLDTAAKMAVSLVVGLISKMDGMLPKF